MHGVFIGNPVFGLEAPRYPILLFRHISEIFSCLEIFQKAIKKNSKNFFFVTFGASAAIVSCFLGVVEISRRFGPVVVNVDRKLHRERENRRAFAIFRRFFTQF